MIRAEIDEAIRQSMTERQFFENLRKRGYEIKVGADISVRPPGKPRFVRLKRNFGEDYTLENIRRRILAQQRPERPLPEPEHKTFAAYSVSYMLCKEYGMDTGGYDFSRLPDGFRESDAQGVRATLSEIRDAAANISGRMTRALEQNRQPKSKEQER